MKNTYYFSHDMNARRDPKIMALRQEHGAVAYGYYWIIIEMLAEAPEYKLPMKDYIYNAMAMEMQCERNAVAMLLDAMINEYELLESDGEFFWSESLLRRMGKMHEASNRRSEAAKKAAEARWGKPEISTESCDGNANAMRTQCDGNANLCDPMPIKGKERKGNKIKDKDILSGEPDGVDTEKTELPNDVSKAKRGSDPIPYAEIVDYLNKISGSAYKHTTKATQVKIRARWNEGYRLDDFKRVIDVKWQDTQTYRRDGTPILEPMYMRPETLFSPKFEGYLNQPMAKQKSPESYDQSDSEELWAKYGIKR